VLFSFFFTTCVSLLQRLITLWHMRKLVIFSCCWCVARHQMILESHVQLQRRITSGKKMCLLHINLSSQLSGYIEEPHGSKTYMMHIFHRACCLRPHHPEHSRLRPISEAKQG